MLVPSFRHSENLWKQKQWKIKFRMNKFFSVYFEQFAEQFWAIRGPPKIRQCDLRWIRFARVICVWTNSKQREQSTQRCAIEMSSMRGSDSEQQITEQRSPAKDHQQQQTAAERPPKRAQYDQGQVKCEIRARQQKHQRYIFDLQATDSYHRLENNLSEEALTVNQNG